MMELAIRVCGKMTGLEMLKNGKEFAVVEAHVLKTERKIKFVWTLTCFLAFSSVCCGFYLIYFYIWIYQTYPQKTDAKHYEEKTNYYHYEGTIYSTLFIILNVYSIAAYIYLYRTMN